MSTEIRISMGERLRSERDRLGLSQPDMAALGGVKPRTYQDWERGVALVSAEFLSEADNHGVDVSYVITGSKTRQVLSGAVPSPAPTDDVISLPLLNATGSMGSGNDSMTEDVILGNVPVSRKWLHLHLPRSRPEALRLVHSYGDSMGDTLRSGDFAIVDTDCQVADIDGIYVLQANDQLFIKRVTRRMDGAHVVTSDNPNVRIVDVLDGSQPVRICGRVVYGWNGRRF
ncbi:MAG: helix-turn-helix transcriptional regulator [Comamonadaceae bacterium]|nr:MAG: helix-turn-helix transcriptional regulator [Comamonadaceae bacterium]